MDLEVDAKGSVYPVIRTIKKLNGEGPTDKFIEGL